MIKVHLKGFVFPHYKTDSTNTIPRDWHGFISAVLIAGLFCIERFYGKYPMPISRYDEGYVMVWGYFNSKGQGNFIRMHSILDP